MNNKLKYIFSIDTKSTNRVIIYLFGIRIRFLKKGMNEKSNEYTKLDCPVSDIPKATGTLRKIQLANLKVLEIFDNLCAENKFDYWLDYGNLLGAARHKGFIPWDDDVDITMPRPDFEKFIELYLKKGIPNYDDLTLVFDNNGCNKCLLKIKHKHITGINIDLFPCDYYFKKLDDTEKSDLTAVLKKLTKKTFYKKVLSVFYKHNNDIFLNKFKKITNKNILKNQTVNIDEKPAIFSSIDYPHSYKHLVFDYETIFPLNKIYYEGKYFYCPNNVDKLLTLNYGDYMKLPEKDCYPRHANSETIPEQEKFVE